MARLSIQRGIITILWVVQLSRATAKANVVFNSAVLKWRNVIPLNPVGRRAISDGAFDPSYRRTKDIQDGLKERQYEDSENWREVKIAENKAQLDKLKHEIQWLTVLNENGIEIGI